MYDRLHHVFQSHMLSNMSAFLKHHSFCSAHLKISKDKREAVIAVAIDLSKAFDSIDHSLLLTELWSLLIGLAPHVLLLDGSQRES